MGLIPSIKTWGTEQLLDSDLNGAFAAIRTTVNNTALFTDVARTVTEVLTFSTAPVFSGAQAFGNSVTVASGLTVTAGGATITAGGLTVTAGGITVSAGASTFADAVSVTGTVTATTFAGSGASLTALPAAELTGTLPAISGANLTSLNASNIASGTINAARLPTIPLATAAVTAGALNAGAGAFTVTPDGAETQFIAATTTASWFGTTAPGGSGTSRWINVTLNGTACRIECKTVA
jgi:hypothetical protein